MVGATEGGTDVSDSENVPSPVQLSRPTNTSAPMPEASSPGRATRLRVAPPIPATSMIRKAPRMGDPSRVLIAAKLPADAITVWAIGGASFLTRRTVRAASPPPRAISGASGPSTAPRLRALRAARPTPASSDPFGAPAPAWKPKAGEWPPLPGRNRMASAVRSPAKATQGTGHQAGTAPSTSWPGRVSNTSSWVLETRARKP